MVNIHDNNFGVCSTAAATAAKTVILNNNKKFVLTEGAVVYVKFTVANSAAVGSITLNVNGTGAKNIKYINQANIPGAGYLRANQTIMFMYDGTYWIYMSNVQHNTDTYDRLRFNVAVQADSSANITAGKLIAYYQNGYRNLTTYANDGESLDFDIKYPILYAASNINAGATGTNNYLAISFNLVNAFPNELDSLTPYKAVYLEGGIPDDGYMDIESITQNPIDDGNHPEYTLLGYAYNTTSIYLLPYHPVYCYDEGDLVEHSSYSGYSDIANVSKKAVVSNTTENVYYKITLNDGPDHSSGPRSFSKSDSLFYNPSISTLYVGDYTLATTKVSHVEISDRSIMFKKLHSSSSSLQTYGLEGNDAKKIHVNNCSFILDGHIYNGYGNWRYDINNTYDQLCIGYHSVKEGGVTEDKYQSRIGVWRDCAQMSGWDIKIRCVKMSIFFGYKDTYNYTSDLDKSINYYSGVIKYTDDRFKILADSSIYILPGNLNTNFTDVTTLSTTSLKTGNITGVYAYKPNDVNDYKLPEIHNYGMMYSVTKGMDLLTCSTAAATAAKTVTHAKIHNDYIKSGTIILIRFDYTNTAANPTLKINTGTAIPIYHHGTSVASGKLVANTLYFFYHNGNSWEVVGTL